MMTGELIWRQDFIDEMYKPHPDPVIRKMEEDMAALTLEFYANMFAPRKYDNSRWLPNHYQER